MADLDNDDFDFDEHGIYREKINRYVDDQGIILDDDGIWRDDGDHLSHYTLRTDSGLGTADRKSSTSTLNKLPENDIEAELGLADQSDFHHPDEEDDRDYREDSYPLEEKSLNISELEGSEGSCYGDSIGSHGDLDLPELNHDSDNATDDQVVAEFDRDDGLGYGDSFLQGSGLQSTGLHSTGLQSSGLHSTADASFELGRSGGFQNGNHVNHSKDQFDDTDDFENIPTPVNRNKPEKSDSIAAYLLEPREEKFIDPRGPHHQVGDSIFTQDEVSHHGQSLVEFEQLEDAMADGEVDNMDLIGAYLQGLQDQEEQEENRHNTSGYYQENRGDKRKESVQSLHSEIGEWQSFENGAEQNGDEPYRGNDRRGQKFPRSDAFDHSESVDRSIPGQLQHSLAHQGDTIQFEESLLENQPPPPGMYSLTLSSLDMTGGDKTQASELSMTQDSRADRRNSKIPMLRSRSPSMSRPGSASPTRGRRDSSAGSRPGSASRPPSGSRPGSASRPPSGSRPDSGSRPGSASRMRSGIPRSRPGSSSQPSSQPSSVPSSPDRGRARKRLPEKKSRTLPQTPTSRSESYSSSRSPSQGRRSLPSISPIRSPMRGSPVRSPTRDFPLKSAQSLSTDSMGGSSQEERDINQAVDLLLGEEDVEIASAIRSGQGQRQPSSPRGRSKKTRPHSAEPIRQANAFPKDLKPRSNTPSSFRIRSQTPTPISSKGQPMKATLLPYSAADNPDLKGSTSFDESEDLSQGDNTNVKVRSRFLMEKQQRKQNEETLNQLQQDYNKLLQKYAQAENTIDSLRIRAKVPIQVELIATGQAQGQAGAPSPGGSTRLNARRGSITSVTSLPVQPSGPISSRPPSSLSQKSGSATTLPGLMGATGTTVDEGIGTLASSMSSESIKVSLLAKAKFVEGQTTAFQTLLEEQHLKIDEQEKALQNIRDGYEDLQESYRNAKEEHEYMRRQGTAPDVPFDENKVVDGELYKLSMKMDDLEHKVEENKKTEASKRVPFQGQPVKADHSIQAKSTGGGKAVDSSKAVDSGTDASLSPNRPPSVGSMVGNPGDIDNKLHQLHKDYSNLMHRYRQLKQMKKTPDRDTEVSGLLENLREIYEQSPEHRKPALPPELENQYDAVHGEFVPHSLSDDENDDDPFTSAVAPPYTDDLHNEDLNRAGEVNESDLSSPKEGKGSGSLSSMGSSASRKLRPKIGNRDSTDASYSDMTESSVSIPSRRSESSGLPGHYHTGGRRRGEDKDSGYMGSEPSRRINSQGPGKDRPRASALSRTRGSLQSRQDDSEVTTTESDRSTIERAVRPQQPTAAAVRGGKQKPLLRPSSGTSVGKSKVRQTGDVSGLRKRGSTPQLRGRGGTPQHGETSSGSEEMSYISGRTGRSGSVKSEQIKNLQAQVDTLRSEMSRRKNSGELHQQQQQEQPRIAHPQPLQPATILASQQPLPPSAHGNHHVAPAANTPSADPYGQGQYYYPYPQDPYSGYYQYGTNGYGQPQPHPESGKENIHPHPSQTNSDLYYQRSQSVPDLSGQHYRNGDQTEEKAPYGEPHYNDYNGNADYRPSEYAPTSNYERSVNYEDRRSDYGPPAQDYVDEVYRDQYRNDYLDSRRRSPYVDDEDQNHSVDDDRTDRLRDYYIPTKSRDDHADRYSRNRSRERNRPRSARDGYERSVRYGDDRLDNRYTKPSERYHNSYRPVNQPLVPPMNGQRHAPQVVPSGVYSHQPVQTGGPVPGVAPPSYQTQSDPCPMCGGAGYHTHGQYVYQPNRPRTAAPPPRQGPVQNSYVAAPNTYMLPPGVNTSTIPAAANTTQNQSFVPVQVVPLDTTLLQNSQRNGNSSSKVRYYVREYGTEPEMGHRRNRSSSRSRSKSRRSRKHQREYYSESESESESEHDLDDSLNTALRTAKDLKHMSRRMKGTLKGELSRSYRENSRGAAYL